MDQEYVAEEKKMRMLNRESNPKAKKDNQAKKFL